MKPYPNTDLATVQGLCLKCPECDGCPYELYGGCMFQQLLPFRWVLDREVKK